MSRAAFEREGVTIRSPNYALVYGYFLVSLLIAVVGIALRAPGGLSWMPMALSGIIVTQLMRRLRKRTVQRLHATHAGLAVDDRVVAPRRRIRQGIVLHEDLETWVRLQGWQFVDVRVDGEAEAQALLRALALDVSSTTASFSLAAGSRRAVVLVAMLLVAMGVGLAGAFLVTHSHALAVVGILGLAMVATMSAAVVFGMSSRINLVVGADGIRIREGFARWDFIPHDAIEDVSARGHELILRAAGRERRYGAGQGARGPQRDAIVQQVAAIAGRIQDARKARASESAVSLTALSRGARSRHEWLEALRGIGAGANEAFREAHVPREDLFRVFESSAAPVSQRVAAAIALRKGGLDEEERLRVAVIPERCARIEDQKRLRIAVTSDEDEQLLDALEAGDEKHRRARTNPASQA